MAASTPYGSLVGGLLPGLLARGDSRSQRPSKFTERAPLPKFAATAGDLGESHRVTRLEGKCAFAFPSSGDPVPLMNRENIRQKRVHQARLRVELQRRSTDARARSKPSRGGTNPLRLGSLAQSGPNNCSATREFRAVRNAACAEMARLNAHLQVCVGSQTSDRPGVGIRPALAPQRAVV
jgi:hypothetical protein